MPIETTRPLAERATISLPELSRLTGIPRSTIYDLARRDALPTGRVIRFGRRIVVSRIQVERLLSGEVVERQTEMVGVSRTND
jgi:predicted DNA-binding transcriptional regulator AlpA